MRMMIRDFSVKEKDQILLDSEDFEITGFSEMTPTEAEFMKKAIKQNLLRPLVQKTLLTTGGEFTFADLVRTLEESSTGGGGRSAGIAWAKSRLMDAFVAGKIDQTRMLEIHQLLSDDDLSPEDLAAIKAELA